MPIIQIPSAPEPADEPIEENGNGAELISRRILNDDELVRLFTGLTRIENRDPEARTACFYVRTVFCTGARRDEARHIRAQDILWVGDTPVITLCYAKQSAKPKGGRGKRAPKDPDVKPRKPRARWCEAWPPGYWARLREYIRGRPGSAWLFPRPDHPTEPAGHTLAWTWFRTMLDQCGVEAPEGEGVHIARRTFATWMADIGEPFDQWRLRQQLGHADLKTTGQYYFLPVQGRLTNRERPRWLDLA